MRMGRVISTIIGFLFLVQSLALHAEAGSNTNSKMLPPIPDSVPTISLDNSPESRLTYSKLPTIIIPQINFEDLDISKALELLTLKSKECDPQHIGIHFLLGLPNRSEPKLSGPQWEVSIHLKDVPLDEVLGGICYDDGLCWVISKGDVFLFLLLPDNQRAASSATPEEIRRQKHLIRKLRSTFIIAKVDFNKADIADVVDFLNKKSKEIDPDHVGVKIVLHLPTPPTAGQGYRRQVTLTLEDAPLDDVLRYVVEQTRLEFEYSINSNEIVIRPLDSKN